MIPAVHWKVCSAVSRCLQVFFFPLALTHSRELMRGVSVSFSVTFFQFGRLLDAFFFMHASVCVCTFAKKYQPV